MSVYEETALRFQHLKEEHIPELLGIEREAYPDPWTEGMFRQELRSHASYFYVVTRGEAIIGYAGFWLVVDEAHITKITVRAEQRGVGYGRTLLRFLLNKAVALNANTVRLEVREANLAARQLYAEAGFVPVGLRRGYYQKTNETAVVMVKNLRDA